MVLALGVVGVGYAAWTSPITIHGTVTTGNLAWEFSGFSVVDSGGATISGVYGANHQDLIVTVTNTYPGWTGKVNIPEINTGSLPLKFSSFGVEVTQNDAGLADYYKLAFLAPDNSINYGPYTLNAIQAVSPVSYSGFPGYNTLPIASNPYVILVGGSHNSVVQLSLDSSITGGQSSTVKFVFTHTATVALP